MHEVSFNQQHGTDLQQVQDWCNRYKQTQDMNNLNQVWEFYYQMFCKIAQERYDVNLLPSRRSTKTKVSASF
jgi:serine/threonine-protein kinase mTOR